MGNVDEIVGEMARRLGYEPTGHLVSEAEVRVYYVQPGDIMGIKAREWGVSLKQLQELNPSIDLGKIRPKQQIRIPPTLKLPEQPIQVSVMLADQKQTELVNAKIRELANSYKLPISLVFAHIYRESGYYTGSQAKQIGYFITPPTTREEAKSPHAFGYIVNAGRTSSAGAKGLYQVMPQNIPEGIDPMDPIQSLELGIDWFVNKSGLPEARKLLNKYLGASNPNNEELLEMALYVYNAGQGTVERALKRKGKDFRLALPNETKNYAPIILNWMRQGMDSLVVASSIKIMVK